MLMKRPDFFSYGTFPLITVLLLGFLSGLPLALTGATLATWLAETHINITTIGLFAAVATPYTLKFLWAPVMDNLPAPLLLNRLGRRRGWIIATQIGLAVTIMLLSLSNPASHPFITACLALLLSFMSASQDIVIDAYRVEILTPEEQGKGAAMVQLGYRLGMIVSSAGALYLASAWGWTNTYLIMAAIIACGMIVACIAPEPALQEDAAIRKPSFNEAAIQPFLEFMKHESWWLILLFIVIYKLADAFIGLLTNPFLLSIGFTKPQIANIVKIYGTAATLFGTFVGGSLVARYGSIRIMFAAGFLHAITNLMYVVQAHVGADPYILAAGTVVENISGGISSAALVAFLSGLCNRHYTATQYALLSSLAALGRTWLSTPAGYVQKALGWEWFFGLATLLALPGLLMLCWLQKRVKL